MYGRIIFQLCSSKMSTWSMKSTSVTRPGWWPCLDREIFGVVLYSALPTAVSCLNYTRRKTKLKNPVKKCFFSMKEVLQGHLLFGEIDWADFHTAEWRINIFGNSVFTFVFFTMKKSWSHKKELWKQASISMSLLMEKSNLSQSNYHEKIQVTYLWHYKKNWCYITNVITIYLVYRNVEKKFLHSVLLWFGFMIW